MAPDSPDILLRFEYTYPSSRHAHDLRHFKAYRSFDGSTEEIDLYRVSPLNENLDPETYFDHSSIIQLLIATPEYSEKIYRREYGREQDQ